VIIPLGLSFYTFQTLSYTIDVYRKKIEPSTNLLNFMCFVSFFPQLVAGPIERAKDLLPQFDKQRRFDARQTTEGLRQILWGLFKKVLIADHLSEPVYHVFSNPEGFGVWTLLFATFLFGVQLYCDFSGYTDIAIGTARIFGFKLSRNFNFPYFAGSMTEFWQRWHITLTRWFTDYVFTPLLRSGKRISRRLYLAALLITMTLIGLWHGARWNYVIFGLLLGLILVVERLRIGPARKPIYISLQKMPGVLKVLHISCALSIPLIFFRSPTLDLAWVFIEKIFTFAQASNFIYLIGKSTTLFILLLIFSERYTQNRDYPLERIEERTTTYLRKLIYFGLIVLLILYKSSGKEFIYFEF
jgi:D-alanyl-lipoteichoic acid acyltransferase DltB (MBOAT superfamily)